MKSLLLLASLMSMAPTAAFAHHHHQVVRETALHTAALRPTSLVTTYPVASGQWSCGGGSG